MAGFWHECTCSRCSGTGDTSIGRCIECGGTGEVRVWISNPEQ